ncbi:MAG: DNA repair protein RecO [Prevotellaceae bacterium]|jgi:DNA repair protein RecO (recombination protein O)|nr:DNA repair protein RecO [Prevotellaceae bacterium]
MDKLRGIVLHSIKYGESSIIAHIYTDMQGRQTYMLNGVRSATKRQKPALIQPLFLLDIEAYPARKQGAMCRMKEFRASVPLQSLPFDVHKNVIALFIGEVLYKLIREEEQNEALFAFLHKHILLLDEMQHGVPNFHLYFLAQLARHLGFFPGNAHSDEYAYFDMKNGLFVPFAPLHGVFINKPASALLGKLIIAELDDLQHIKTSREQRNLLLRKMLDYYCTHLGMANPIRSLAVLEEVFA